LALAMTIIAVDEDTRMLRQIPELLGQQCEVLITTDTRKAMAWLAQNHSVSSILVGELIRGEAGLEVLKTARELRPEVRRVLITGYADLPSIVDGLHTGVIDRLLAKPLVPTELSTAVAVPEPRTPAMVARITPA
jgi:DNA-binding NtrC family response regulator